MESLLKVVALGSLAIAQVAMSDGQAPVASPQSALRSANPAGASPAGDIPGLPPLPKGKSTILGGEIRRIDPVRDELTLKVFGQRPIKILFDERTEVFRDGKRVPLRNLGPVDHASVQTLLDGTDVYALSIHILTLAPEGEYQGRVLTYNPETSELTMSSVVLREPIKLMVPSSTQVVRVGQPAFTALHPGTADLIRGALVSVQFQSDKQGRGVADHISVYALPGSEFVFIGNITALDLHSGILAVVDPQDDKTYQISFDSARLPVTQSLHTGDHVIVTADFQGARYIATAITINN
jgi:hypothetical protein